MPNALPSTFGKRTVMIWSGDRTAGGSFTSFSVQLNDYLQGIVYAEWKTCSVAGYCVEVKQFPNTSSTSRHTGSTTYWRFINSLTNAVNYTTQPFPDSQWNPTSISMLTVNVFNPDGTVPTLSTDWLLEIDVWYVQERR
jgi:hypothetical protein